MNEKPKIPHQDNRTAPWKLSFTAPEVVPATDPTGDIKEVGPNDSVISKPAHDAGRRVVLLAAGRTLDTEHRLPSQVGDGVHETLDGEHIVVVDQGMPEATIPVRVEQPAVPINLEHPNA